MEEGAVGRHWQSEGRRDDHIEAFKALYTPVCLKAMQLGIFDNDKDDEMLDLSS